jgi:hypothetical protein
MAPGTRHRSSCERGLDPDDLAVMAFNNEGDLALLLVAVVTELEWPLGPFGLAQELRRNEALEDCPATPPPTAIRGSSAR